MNHPGRFVVLLAGIILIHGISPGAPERGGRVVYLDELDTSAIIQMSGKPPQRCRSVEGKPLRVGGREYARGIGTHARSEFHIGLDAAALRFNGGCGVDDEVGTSGTVYFEAWVDGKKAAASGLKRGGDSATTLTVDLRGAKRLTLLVDHESSRVVGMDHADWVDARIELLPGTQRRPKAHGYKPGPAPRVASGDPVRPVINHPRVVGASPGKPFLFRIPATGESPLRFEAAGLPEGVELDTDTGILSGSLVAEGTTTATITVINRHGGASSPLVIVAGKGKLAQTPPMGWNPWNCWHWAINDQKMRLVADVLTTSGLAAHGYQYVCIDDVWQKDRGPEGRIRPADKFPDMKALGDYIHSKGLKFGIYSSPGPKTCADFVGSYQFEREDAETFASWGVDYLKHDWCHYSKVCPGWPKPEREELVKPYRVMAEALEASGRDVVYSLCQYGMGAVWEWGPGIGANLWRTSGDILDNWGSVSNIGFRMQAGLSQYAGPGHWNDPDMLVVGEVGCLRPLHPTLLSPDEQLTHLSLWSLQAAPLIIGCAMDKLDKWTLDILKNDEVLAVNQDFPGRAGDRIRGNEFQEVWARPLEDGSVAVGLFNRDIEPARIVVPWGELGLKGRKAVRDLWAQRDLGRFDGEFDARVPPHGVVLVRISDPAPDRASRRR